jgi:hypothetical protein
MSRSSLPPCLDPQLSEASELEHKLDSLRLGLELRNRLRAILSLGIDGIPESTVGTEENPSVVERGAK